MKGEGKEILIIIVQKMENLHAKVTVTQPNPLGRQLWKGFHTQNFKIPVNIAHSKGFFSRFHFLFIDYVGEFFKDIFLSFWKPNNG